MARRLINWAGPKKPKPDDARGAGPVSEEFSEISRPANSISVKNLDPDVSLEIQDNYWDEVCKKNEEEKQKQRDEKRARGEFTGSTEKSWDAISVPSPELSHHYSPSRAILYPHESWMQFRHSALKLSEKYLGHLGEIKVRPLHGGSYNRVVNVLVNGKSRFILRTPRDPLEADIEAEVAPLLFLRRNTPIQSPVVTAYDVKWENAIDAPFMIQEKLPGLCLYPAWYEKDTLSSTQRLRVAHDLGLAYRQLLATHSSEAGHIVFDGEPGLEGKLAIAPIRPLYAPPYHKRNTKGAKPWTPGPQGQPVAAFMRELIQSRIVNARKQWPKVKKTQDRLNNLMKIIDKMEATGKLNNVKYCLFHWDIAGRNLIFNPDARKGESSIGMIDWDDVTFAPAFMICDPPDFLWDMREFKLRTESIKAADGRPGIDPRLFGSRVQQVFEDAAGPEYKKYTQDPFYAVARRYVKYGMEGAKDKTDEKGERAFILGERWKEYLDMLPLFEMKNMGI